MGKRKRDRQLAMWMATTDLPTAASHPFYRRLNQVLREHGFDDVVETRAAEPGCDRGRGLTRLQCSSELVGTGDRAKRQFFGHVE